jgi:hypothetical protein
LIDPGRRRGPDLMAFIGKPLLVGADPDAVEVVGPGRAAIAVTLRGPPEWKDRVLGLADHCRMDVSKVIDRALIDYARKESYNEEAPSR